MAYFEVTFYGLWSMGGMIGHTIWYEEILSLKINKHENLFSWACYLNLPAYGFLKVLR